MNRFLSLLLVICTLFQVGSAFADAGIKLLPGVGEYRLGSKSFFVEDVEGNFTIEQVVSRANPLEWEASKSDMPNFAFSKSVFWVKVEFVSGFNKPTDWWFELAFPLHDYLDYYVVDGEQVLHHVKTGDRLPMSSRSYKYRNFLFDLEVPAGQTRQVYLRVKSFDGLHEPVDIILWDKETFGFENGLRNLGFGVYFGVLFVIALYNIFIYVSVKDKAYLFYVLYIFFFNIWLFGYYGYSAQYIWPDSPTWGNKSIIAFTCGWAIFVVLFIRSFLNTPKHAPWFERIGIPVVIIMLANIIIGFFDFYALGIFLVLAVGTPSCIFAIAAGFASWRAGYRPATYFLLAWTALFVSLIFFCLKIAAIIPSSWAVEISIQIGSIAEVVLLSLGLADRINVLKKEKIQAQEDALKSFESSLQLKNDFITSITHELRTPMNAIMGGLQVAESKFTKDLESPLGIIQSGATDMMNIVNDILTHTEIQSGQLSIQNDNVNIRELCEQYVCVERPKCESKGLAISLDVDSNLPEVIVTDQEKLGIVLNKLLGNASKFTESGYVELLVKSHEESKRLEISVSDTGQGISEEDKDKIFNPFEQRESGFTRRHGGIGIGLSICERLAQALGGTLTVQSIKGRGSTFTLEIPLVEGQIEEKPQEASKGTVELPVLVVEDNLVNQKVIVKMLGKLGLTALVANHGGEALDLLNQQDVSLVLMDLQMPVMDGFTCTEKIRKRSDGKEVLPIIAVSANLMDADKRHCKESGVNDYIEKPVKLRALESQLAVFIDF